MNEIDTLIPAVTTEEIQTFCDGLTNYFLESDKALGFDVTICGPRQAVFTEGPRWFRVCVQDKSSKYIYALVDKSNGDIYKPTSYKGGPAPHVRGNIRLPHLGTCCQRNSIVYLRG